MHIPILGGRSSDDLGRRVVKLSIVIVVQNAGVEQFLLANRNQDLISKGVLERVQESKLSSKICGSVCGLPKGQSQHFVLDSRIEVIRNIGGRNDGLLVRECLSTHVEVQTRTRW